VSLANKTQPNKLTNERIGNKQMKIKASIWDNTKTRILAIQDFDNTKELQDFMKELHIVESKAVYRIMEVSK
jgi:hypothetical protein